MNYTGERIVPAHDDVQHQGNVEQHKFMYSEFLIAAENKVVIDVACGCGLGTKMLSERAKTVYGYDVSSEAVEFANKYYNSENIAYGVGDIRSLKHTNESVDVVVSVETFEHVVDANKMIDEVHRVLKPNGLWCFTTPNGERYPDNTIVQGHVKHYTEAELLELLDYRFSIYVRRTGYEPDSSVILKQPTFGNYSVFAIKRQ